MNLKKINVGVFLLVLVVFGVSGCATIGSDTGNLSHYENLARGKYLAGFYMRPGLQASDIQKIYVNEFVAAEDSDPKAISPELALLHLKIALKSQVLNMGLQDSIVFDEVSDADAFMRLVISEIQPGSRQARLWAGEYGFGHAYTQVEGEIRDRNGMVLIEFNERRRHSGQMGIRDTYIDSSASLIKEMLEQISEGIVKELKDAVFT